jgi:hypothetical protein
VLEAIVAERGQPQAIRCDQKSAGGKLALATNKNNLPDECF